MDHETKNKALERLRRIAGQVSGIQRMLDEDRHCADVLLQVAAAQGALREAGRVILSGQVEDCLGDALRNRDPRERRKKLDAFVRLFSRFLPVEQLGTVGSAGSDQRNNGYSNPRNEGEGVAIHRPCSRGAQSP